MGGCRADAGVCRQRRGIANGRAGGEAGKSLEKQGTDPVLDSAGLGETAEAVRLELTRVLPPTRFRDEFLIRPDRFRVVHCQQRKGWESNPQGTLFAPACFPGKVAEPLAIPSKSCGTGLRAGEVVERKERELNPHRV